MKVIGYAYDADVHCIECTEKYLAYEVHGSVCSALRITAARYKEENKLHAVFDIDEDSERYHCGDCFTKLMY